MAETFCPFHLQVIAAGDVFQLPPVPNRETGDDGQYFFEHTHIDLLFPHTYTLTEVYRQEQGNFSLS